MVFQDLSTHSTHDLSEQQTSALKIASVGDRFSAFIFDVLILTPLVGLFLAPLYKKVQFLYYVEPSSTEFFVLVFIFIFAAASLVAFFQSLFLIFFAATPGKNFFKLKVVSVSEESLHWSAYFLRSFLWVTEVLFFFIPFLAVLSNSKRRPLHDRAAGTMVITLKAVADQGPHRMETHLIRQVILIFGLFMMAWVLTFMQYLYKLAINGEFKRSEATYAQVCQEMGSDLSGTHRMDMAIGLYLARQVSEECLESEADHALWTPSSQLHSWGYLAKALYNSFDKEKSDEYFVKTCEDKGEACQIAKILNNQLPTEIGESVSAKVIWLTQKIRYGQYEATQNILSELNKHIEFEDFVAAKRLQILWMQGQQEKALGAYELLKDLSHGSSEDLRLSAWLCLEQMDMIKGDTAAASCDNLKSYYLIHHQSIDDPYVGLALVVEKTTRHSTSLDWVQFKKLFEKHKDLLQITEALSSETALSVTERKKVFQNLSKNGSFEGLRERAWLAWSRLLNGKEEVLALQEELKSLKRRDLFWKKVNEIALGKIPSSNRMPASSSSEIREDKK